MLFQKKKKFPQHKELNIIRLELIDYIICLNKKSAEIYNDECSKIGLNIFSLKEALPKLVNLYDLKNKDSENNDDSNSSLKDSKKYYYFRERQKKDKKKLNFGNEDRNNFLNKKRNNHKKNNNNKDLIKNKNNYIYINKNSAEYLNNNVIPREDLFKFFKILDNKIGRKREKNIVTDKVQMSIEEKKEFINEIRNRFLQLSLAQVMEIQHKFFNDSSNNCENGIINIELNKLSQEKLKRLYYYIQDYEMNNLLDPNFINYKEEIKRRNSEKKNPIVNNIHNFSFNNHKTYMSDFDDSDDSDDDDDNLSDESNQKKIDSNIQENENNLNKENLSNEYINHNFIPDSNEVNNSDIFENYSNLSDNE